MIEITAKAEIIRKGFKRSSLDIHPYFGKFDPSIPENLIKRYSSIGDLLFDPFCGSGTSLHEAVLLKRNIIGTDASPLACLISIAKICGIDEKDKESIQLVLTKVNSLLDDLKYNKENEQIIFDLENASEASTFVWEPSPIPEMPRVHDINSWFTENALKELSCLKGIINNAPVTTRAYIHLLVSFSSIITKASNQTSESKYSRTAKDDTPGRIFKLFINTLKGNMNKVDLFSKELDSLGISPVISEFKWPFSRSTIEYHSKKGVEYKAAVEVLDSREYKEGPEIDLIITSPPYLYSWDYGLYHKFRFYWLDLDLDLYENQEIGRHLRRKNDDVPKYIEDMNGFFKNMSRVLKSEKFCVLVNSNSKIKGKDVDSNSLLVECAKLNSISFISSYEPMNILGPHTGRYPTLDKDNKEGPKQKKETILVFKK